MSTDAPLHELTVVLRRERDLLDQLRFRFLETRLLLAAEEVRYLRWATAEVEQARMRAREADLLRAAALHQLDGIGAVVDHQTLRGMAIAAAEPWAGILRDHHEGLCTVVSEIEMIGHRNAELARCGITRLAEAAAPSPIDRLLDAERHEGSGGIALAPATLDLDAEPCIDEVADHVEETVLQLVIASASRLQMPALLAFLR